MKRLLLLFVVLSSLSVAQDVPFSRGVNLTGWFQTSSIKQVQFTKFTKQDFINIKSLGCDVIRLPVRLDKMTSGAPDYTVDPLFYFFIDQIIDWAEELEMYLILDNHATETAVFEDPNLESILITVWSQVLQHYKNHSDFLIYEIINEPHDITDKKWNDIQGRVLDAMRAIDQKHSIIVTPAGWGSYNNLKYMPQYTHDNLIYSFHFYDPFLFTHQGAGWTNLGPLHGVPFPYDAARMPDCPPELKGTWVEGSLNTGYKNDGTPEKVKELINIAITFRDDRNVRIFCGEFGVYNAFSDPADRVTWYGLAPPYLSENNIPWTMWDYAGGFGLFEKGGSDLFEHDVNVALVEAMGLTPPPQSEFVLKPDTAGFDIFTDFIAPRITESSSTGDGFVDFYSTSAVKGQYCIHMTEVGQYNNSGFNFKPIKDMTTLVKEGYALDLYLKSDFADMQIDIRFIDTKTDDPDDHPWRMRVTVDKNLAKWDGTWKHLQIPLTQFTEHGSWDNGWFNPIGAFDWSHISKLEIVSEHHDFKGKNLWIDQIRVVDPAVVSVENQTNSPQNFSLQQNYPNPFNPTTTIHYSLSHDTDVELAIYNALGQQIRTLIDTKQSAGQQSVQWDGLNDAGKKVSSGVYVYQLRADELVETRKMMLMP